MTSVSFVYWLQGMFELCEPKTLNEKQTDLIRRHLHLVFKHEIDPSMPDPTGELQAIHHGKPNKPNLPFNSSSESLTVRC